MTIKGSGVHLCVVVLAQHSEVLGSLCCADQKSGGLWDVAGHPCLTAVQKLKVRKAVSQQPESQAGPVETGTVGPGTVVHTCQPSCAVVS